MDQQNVIKGMILGLAVTGLTACVGSVAPEPKKQAYAPKTNTHTPKTYEEVQTAHINKSTKFSTKEYGVEGSPRVTTQKRPRKGGGRYQIGKPYQIKGRWYRPKHDPNLKQTGLASWYGPNFHGRLTANGEIYDQFALTAAHPTLPLPSYARVTNLENGRKITVRVNDRGPFAPNRVIDLSARAAKLLGYDRQGLAKVKVEYAGEAPLHGKDENVLLASYIGPKGTDRGAPASSPSTMIAMAAPGQMGAPAQAIHRSFGDADLSFVTANSVVPTARPTLFEGVPLRESQTVVYRAVPLPQSVVGENTLSFAAEEGHSDPLAAVMDSYREIRIEQPWLEGSKVEVEISLGGLTDDAVQRIEVLLSDLVTKGIVRSGEEYRLRIRESDANSALTRLRAAGLVFATIL